MRSSEQNTKSPRGENDRSVKSPYLSPTLVPLGELARGFARCQNGSLPADECTDGVVPVMTCQVGTGGIA